MKVSSILLAATALADQKYATPGPGLGSRATAPARPMRLFWRSDADRPALGCPTREGLVQRCLRSTLGAFIALLAIGHGQVALAIGHGQVALAQPAGQSSVNLSVNAYHDNDSFSQIGLPATALLGAVSASDSAPNGTSTALLSASASGRAQAKSIGVSAVASASAYSATSAYGTGSFAMAQAMVNVPFLVNHPLLNGTAGMLQARLNVSGALSLGAGLLSDPALGSWSPYAYGQSYAIFWATGLANGPSGPSLCGYYQAQACGEKLAGYLAQSSGYSSAGLGVNGSWLLNIPFQFDSWSSYSLTMWVNSNVTAVGGSGTSVSLTGSARYEHSADWGGITQILDANGNPVTGWSVQSLPGVDLLTPVPEPQTWLLLLSGLALLGRLMSRRRG